jgi:hypothetical protein
MQNESNADMESVNVNFQQQVSRQQGRAQQQLIIVRDQQSTITMLVI